LAKSRRKQKTYIFFLDTQNGTYYLYLNRGNYFEAISEIASVEEIISGTESIPKNGK
jgi:hypothetical protein